MTDYNNMTSNNQSNLSNTTLNDSILQPINYTTNDEDVYVVTRIQLMKHVNHNLFITQYHENLLTCDKDVVSR